MTNRASTCFKSQISNLKFRISNLKPWFSQTATPVQAVVRCCLLALFVCVLCNSAFGRINDSSRYQTGVRNSSERALNSKQIEKLLRSLREKTGFPEMHFDQAGFLNLGDRAKIEGGSATARELLIAAVDRARAIDLENHDHSVNVAFAQLGKSVIFTSRATGARIEVYPVEIDFSDFAHLRGDRATLSAFDIGFVVLHELAHAALGLRDSRDETGGPGECEDYVNRIRRELGLPERQNYVARIFNGRNLATGKSLPQAELLFARTIEQDGRTRIQSLNLMWEAEPVGTIKPAAVKPSSIAAHNRKSASGTPAP